jgi:hypothetical protein
MKMDLDGYAEPYEMHGIQPRMFHSCHYCKVDQE